MTDVNHTVTGSEGSTNAGGSAAPGSQTDPTLLLQSLQEEREKRRIAEDAKAKAEADLLELQNALASGDGLSEEGKVLKTQIDELQGTISKMNTDNVLSGLQAEHPALKDKAAEFQAYVDNPENAGMSLTTAAKAFLVDNNLLHTQTRKGIEKPSGGGRTATPQGMTYAQAGELRSTNFRKYSQLLREGKLDNLVE